uniref:Catechol O-methyltransferase n=1 Tax=Alexandrium monilatum TaxID=311494 RepID=A0A7S4S9D7_9DINO
MLGLQVRAPREPRERPPRRDRPPRTPGASAIVNTDAGKLWALLRDRSTKAKDFEAIVAALRQRHLVQEPKEFTLIISSCGRQGRWRDAVSWLQEMQLRQMEPNAYAYSAAIHACVRGQRGTLALSLFEKMRVLKLPQDAITYCSAITACQQGIRWQQALSLLDEMQTDEVQVNTIHCNAAISACSGSDRWPEAISLLERMRTGALETDVITFSAVISACETGGKWQPALQLLSEMLGLSIQSDVVSCSAVISACGKGEAWQWALALLGSMKREGPRPSDVSYGAAISACETAARWEWSLELLQDMQRQGIALTVVTCSAAISACAQCFKWEWALELFDEMLRRKLTPNRITYGAAIFACEAKWEVALGLLRRAEREDKWKVLGITYTTVISSCSRGGRWDLACILLEDQQRAEGEEGRLGLISYSAVLRACERSGKAEQVLQILREMVHKGIEPDIGTYNVAISACSAGGLWDQMLMLMNIMVKNRMTPNKDTYITSIMETEQRGTGGMDVLLGGSSGTVSPMAGSPSDDSATAASLRMIEDLHNHQLARLLQTSFDAARTMFPLPQKDLAPLVRLDLSSPYAKELRVFQQILAFAVPSNPGSICVQVEDFNKEVLANSDVWSKIAGGMKTELLTAALRSSPSHRPVLEIGTYIGYSALEMAIALPEARITTVEVDPVHVAVARGVISFAGLADRVKVLTGHCQRLLPRLAQPSHGQALPRFGMVFMDRWGSQYHEDLAVLEQYRGLLARGAVIVADNIRRTGAPLFLWRVAAQGPFRSHLARVCEFASGPLDEDWMSVSVYRGRAAASLGADKWREVPSDLEQLHQQCERNREISLTSDRKSTPAKQRHFAIEMERRLAAFGIVVDCTGL